MTFRTFKACWIWWMNEYLFSRWKTGRRQSQPRNCKYKKKRIFWKISLRTFQNVVDFVRQFFGESTLLVVPLIHNFSMARLSLHKAHCTAMFSTSYECYYVFQKLQFIVSSYITFEILHTCSIKVKALVTVLWRTYLLTSFCIQGLIYLYSA